MIEEKNKSRLATNIYSNENESKVFANSSQSDSEMTNSFVNDDSISSEEKNLNQRHMMTKALSIEDNSFEDLVMQIQNEENHKASDYAAEWFGVQTKPVGLVRVWFRFRFGFSRP
jgi:hypothetical protein